MNWDKIQRPALFALLVAILAVQIWSMGVLVTISREVMEIRYEIEESH